MGRRSAGLLVMGSVVLALGACSSGGSGDDDAFCDSLEVLSEQVADGDLASDDGLEDAVETANDLNDAASDDQADAVTEVGQTLAEADADEADETAETIQDELGDFADDCDIDEFAEAPETTTTTGPEDTTTTTDPDGTTTTTEEGGGGATEEVAGRQPIPADLEPEFAGLADLCFRGDFASCDELFNTTPGGSVAEEYGDTCGGRIADGRRFDFECITLISEPFAPPADVSDPATATACFEGDMAACDVLLQAGPDSAEGVYGFFCGGRLDEEVVADAALCVDIFGPVAEFA